MNDNNKPFLIEKENFTCIVGELIRKYRENENITQEALGDLTDCDRTYIGSIERGEKNASFYVIYKILLALKIEPSDFFNNI